MTHPEWNDLLTDCCQSTEFMELSTYGPKGLWVNPVYFAWDEKFNLYFISQMNCKHMDNIASNPEVACAIFPTSRPVGDDVFGLYLKGDATLLTDPDDISIADEIYYGRVYPDQNKENDSYRSDPSWHFIKVAPSGLWYFDTRYFEENRVKVPPELWR